MGERKGKERKGKKRVKKCKIYIDTHCISINAIYIHIYPHIVRQ